MRRLISESRSNSSSPNPPAFMHSAMVPLQADLVVAVGIQPKWDPSLAWTVEDDDDELRIKIMTTAQIPSMVDDEE